MKVLVHKREKNPTPNRAGMSTIPLPTHSLVLDYEGWLFGISSDGNATDGIDTMAVVMKPDGFFITVPVSWVKASAEAVHDRFAQAVEQSNCPY